MSKISNELNTIHKFPATIGDPHWSTTSKQFETTVTLDETTFDVFKDVVKNKTEDKIMKNVNHPSHYQTSSGIEVIDVIEAFDLGFSLGNVVKYILRCGKKDADVQELEKAKWYLEREISNRKNKQ